MYSKTDKEFLLYEEEISYSLNLRIKEGIMILIIMLMAMAGIKLSADKIFTNQPDKVEEVIIANEGLAVVN